MGERADEMRGQQPQGDVNESPPVSEPVGAKDPEEIRQDIERTRAEMGETIDEIQERLSPEHLKESVRRETIGRAQEIAGEASARAKDTGTKLVERARPALEQARDKASPLGHQAQEQAQRGRARFRQLQEENPGLAAVLVIGTLTAILLLFWLVLRRNSN
jgi:ElaB/YqjD/DUF883 family membrane-anchored ribosome-binding protein